MKIIHIVAWLCGFNYGAFHVESCLALSSRVFSVLLYSIVITSPSENIWSITLYVLLVHLFVYFARVYLCPFSLPLGVGGWLSL